MEHEAIVTLCVAAAGLLVRISWQLATLTAKIDVISSVQKTNCKRLEKLENLTRGLQ